MVELLALGALSFAASCRNPGCSTGRWRPFTQPPTSGSPDHCNHTMPALVLWASPGAARTLVGILCGAQRAVQPSGRDLEPAPRYARAPIMTTVSQDRGDASAGAGEPGYEASFGDRQRESRGRCARCGGSSSASTPDRRGPRRYEGWLGRPAFKIANIRDSNVAGRCQRVADGDQTPCSVAAITQRDLLGRPGRRQVRPADLARLVIALDRPRVERRAPSYGCCISEDREAVLHHRVRPAAWISGHCWAGSAWPAILLLAALADHRLRTRGTRMPAGPSATLTVTATALSVIAMLILSDA